MACFFGKRTCIKRIYLIIIALSLVMTSLMIHTIFLRPRKDISALSTIGINVDGVQQPNNQASVTVNCSLDGSQLGKNLNILSAMNAFFCYHNLKYNSLDKSPQLPLNVLRV